MEEVEESESGPCMSVCLCDPSALRSMVRVYLPAHAKISLPAIKFEAWPNFLTTTKTIHEPAPTRPEPPTPAHCTCLICTQEGLQLRFCGAKHILRTLSFAPCLELTRIQETVGTKFIIPTFTCLGATSTAYLSPAITLRCILPSREYCGITRPRKSKSGT